MHAEGPSIVISGVGIMSQEFEQVAHRRIQFAEPVLVEHRS